MSAIKQLSELVGLLPEEEQTLVLELVIRLLPDNVATPEDLADIAEARAEYVRGETVNLTPEYIAGLIGTEGWNSEEYDEAEEM